MRFVSILFIISAFILSGYIIFTHENIHQKIYQDYDIESSINYFIFPSPTTYPEKPCPTDSCKFANEMNEIVSYPFISIYFIIVLGIFILINLTEERIELEKLNLEKISPYG